jgi:hypothetical protein
VSEERSTELVDQLVERWYEECENRGFPTEAYSGLRHGLRDFLPADTVAGIAFDDDCPVIVALTPRTLLRFAPPAQDHLLDATAVNISAIASLQVTCVLEGSGDRSNFRACTWALRFLDGQEWRLVTRAPIGTSFASDNGGEGVLLELADCLGWDIPLHSS